MSEFVFAGVAGLGGFELANRALEIGMGRQQYTGLKSERRGPRLLVRRLKLQALGLFLRLKGGLSKRNNITRVLQIQITRALEMHD